MGKKKVVRGEEKRVSVCVCGGGGCYVEEKVNVLVLQLNILGTIMSSCACCSWEWNDNASMLRV